MDEQQLNILAECEKTVTSIFTTQVKPSFLFHNLEHTRQVVNAAQEIAFYYKSTDNDHFILQVAAWFHDTGYSSGHAEGHETESARLATEFLRLNNAGSAIIQGVVSCIGATSIPQHPANATEKIICDADLFHLGTPWFVKMTDYLRRELQAYYYREIKEEQWRQHNIAFLIGHKYFTGYCQEKLEPVKQEWVTLLQQNYRQSDAAKV